MRSALVAMSPGIGVLEGVILAALKTYFDGSGNKSDARFLVLACISADEDTWTPIHSKWESVRKTRGNPPYIHMTDAMALEGEFKNWTVQDRDYLIDGLLNVFLEFAEHPRLRAFTCSVDLAAHRREQKKRIIPSPEKLCARIVFPTMLDWYESLPDTILDVIDLVFDKNEGYRRHIHSDWTSKELRRKHPVWGLIRSVGEAAMELTPELQMADMVAWGRNRLLCYSHYEKPWEHDVHYTTTVRAANTLRGFWKEIDANHLERSPLRDEGFDAINRQRREQMKRNSEFYKFERMLEKLLKVPHSEIKAKLEAEKKAKLKKPRKAKK